MALFYMVSMKVGKLLVLLGFAISTLGFYLWFGPRIPGINRLGKLPGDIRIEKENFSFYFPWVTCLLLSALITLVLKLFRGKS